MNEHKPFIEAWKALHAGLWQRYTNSEANEKLLLEGAQRFRPCITAIDRSFQENKASFVRTDGKTEEDDRLQAEERQAAQAAALEASTVVDHAFLEYIMSLSQAQVAIAYYSDPSSEFAMKYRICVRDLGYRLPPRPARPTQPTQPAPFVRRGVQS